MNELNSTNDWTAASGPPMAAPKRVEDHELLSLSRQTVKEVSSDF